MYISDIPPYISNIHPYTVLYTADMHQTESVEDDGSADEYFDTVLHEDQLEEPEGVGGEGLEYVDTQLVQNGIFKREAVHWI